jgi:hypothetical protein
MTFVEPPTLDVLPRPFFIVTEGMGDARFVDKLLIFKGITNCSIGCPSTASAMGMGKDAFPKYFSAIQAAMTRAESVPLRGLLVIADANGNADQSFDAIVTALQTATFPVPNHPFTISGNEFKVAVYLVPGEGETGTLEHLLLKAVFQKTPGLEKCLEDFSRCTGGLRSTKPNTEAKMRMSALAAAFCSGKPWCSLANMWSDNDNPVPIDSSHFDHLANFVTNFAV